MARPVVVLGASGMLGHRVLRRLAQKHVVVSVVRGPRLPPICESSSYQLDVLDTAQLAECLRTVQPSAVINCVGLVPQRPEADDPTLRLRLNGILPHVLATQCAQVEARLIHISTDCVFSGAHEGRYREDDERDAVDSYGRTKLFGEVVDSSHVLTIRTSMVGYELGTQYGLLEWFLHHPGPVNGFTRVRFSGVTTDHLAELIDVLLTDFPSLRGLYHIAGPPITKYALLQLFREVFEHPIEIESEPSMVLDRTLDDSKFRAKTGIPTMSWRAMLQWMQEEGR